MLVQVNGTKFVRDTDSMALINKDVSGLEEYRQKRKMMENQRRELNTVRSEMDSLKQDVGEIKQLLLKLLEGTNG